MKKAFGQTVRDLKRGVNKKVLKVPGIEQKVLDATSNESWGPHGSLLADIAHASRNYHEYQLTMGVLWKRLSDTGKNWRHVYKALTVLEYLVGHGSERIIEEIKERAYQISILSSFQYIDSSGKDQGSNVRKKAQSLVALVNDKERIAEVREKAAANREKYHNSTVGGMHMPSGGYGDKYDYEGRYGDRDEERSSYGREREYGYRDDDKNSRDVDRYSKDSEDRDGRDSNRDDEYHGSRGRSSDRERPIEDDGQSSSRDSGARADDHSQDGRGGMERKFSEQNIGAAPPSYEEAVSESRSPVYSERDGGETPQVAPPAAAASPSAENSSVDNKTAGFVNGSSPQHVESFDEFDPRGSVSASVPAAGASASAPSPSTVVSTSAMPAPNNSEMDLLGSLSDVFSPNPLAIVTSDSTSVENNGQPNTGPAPSFSTSQSSPQSFDDPFGESPFKAITSADIDPSQHQNFGAPFQPTPPTSNPDNGHSFGFGEAFTAVPNHEPGVQNMQAPPNSSVLPQEQFDTSESDILAGILPPSGPPVSLSPQPNSTVPASQFPPNSNSYESYHHQAALTDPNMPGQTPFGQASQHYNMVSHSQNHPEGMQFNNGGFTQHPGYAGSANSQPPQYTPGLSPHPTSESFPHQPGSATSSSSQAPYATTSNAPAGQFDGGNFMTQQPYDVTQKVNGAPSHVPHRTQSGPVAAYGNNNNVVGDMHQPGSAPSSSAQTPYATTSNAPAGQFDGGNFMTQQPYDVTQKVNGAPSHVPHRTQSGPVAAYGNNNNVVGDMHQPGSAPSSSAQTPYPTTPNAPAGQFDGGNFMTQQPYDVTQQVHGAPSHVPHRTQSGPVAAYWNNNNVVGDMHQPGSAPSSSSQTPYPITPNAPAGQFDGGNFMTQQAHGVPSHIPQRTQSGPVAAHGNSNNVVGDMFAPAGLSSLETSASQPSLTPLTGAIEIVVPQSQKKFEPKSTIWADTLSRGLVNFNISGPKTNPLADIGVDFEAINRKEKRLEKPTTAQQQVTSTINMGKAMGSGTGLGRAGAGAMRPPTNSMVGSSMPTGMNAGGYGGMNQNHPMGIQQNHPMGMNQHYPMGMNQNYPMGMNQNHSMGMNHNQPMGNQNYPMGMGMNMGGYGQGYPMQPQQGMGMAPPGPPQGMTGAYNPMMGQGGYNPQQQQPYGGGGYHRSSLSDRQSI
ncbi:PREDICTED: clathrin interactor EPSIN 3-like isoform X2 [Camelina sativa]|uniref:Clathrin interactor EPSIN 3-like isoform X2 n=1 Tax=Camelina sativa TaxID=90675 RepID=A0ABM1Q839_CAMSA|nr:PREDICTED: clathrin interactor EPSIN 3-like isoform X2 [Camelina sativa]